MPDPPLIYDSSRFAITTEDMHISDKFSATGDQMESQATAEINGAGAIAVSGSAYDDLCEVSHIEVVETNVIDKTLELRPVAELKDLTYGLIYESTGRRDEAFIEEIVDPIVEDLHMMVKRSNSKLSTEGMRHIDELIPKPTKDGLHLIEEAKDDEQNEQQKRQDIETTTLKEARVIQKLLMVIHGKCMDVLSSFANAVMLLFDPGGSPYTLYTWRLQTNSLLDTSRLLDKSGTLNYLIGNGSDALHIICHIQLKFASTHIFDKYSAIRGRFVVYLMPLNVGVIFRNGFVTRSNICCKIDGAYNIHVSKMLREGNYLGADVYFMVSLIPLSAVLFARLVTSRVLLPWTRPSGYYGVISLNEMSSSCSKNDIHMVDDTCIAGIDFVGPSKARYKLRGG